MVVGQSSEELDDHDASRPLKPGTAALLRAGRVREDCLDESAVTSLGWGRADRPAHLDYAERRSLR